jgi:hypothetical protein
MEEDVISSEPNQEQQDLPAMPTEKQMEAMGLVGNEGLAEATPAREQEDLPSMSPEKQTEAMGVQAPEQRAELSDVEPELAAYRDAQAREQG